jgi:hypothetical protein
MSDTKTDGKVLGNVVTSSSDRENLLRRPTDNHHARCSAVPDVNQNSIFNPRAQREDSPKQSKKT